MQYLFVSFLFLKRERRWYELRSKSFQSGVESKKCNGLNHYFYIEDSAKCLNVIVVREILILCGVRRLLTFRKVFLKIYIVTLV